MFRFRNVFFKLLVVLFVFKKCTSFNLSHNFTNVAEMSIYLQHISNKILSRRSTQLTVVQSVKNQRAKYFLNQLVDDYSKSLNYHKKIDAGPITKTEDFSEYFIIIYYATGKKDPEHEIQKIFNYCWQFYTVNVVLLLKTEHEVPIKLYTYYPFTRNSCKNAQLHIINYNKSILQMSTSEIFPNKFITFHNCTLVAALWNVPPYLTLPERKPGSVAKEMGGFEGYLLNVLSQVLEFQIDYIIPPNNEQRGLIDNNGSLTGAAKMLNDHSADLSLGSFRCTLDRSTVLSPSMTFYQTMQVFTVLALSQPWSSLEIIAFPFQLHIWIILMLLLIFLLSSPSILKCYFKNALKFIYGFSSIYLINTNTVAVSVSQNATALPKRNFARFTLFMWIWLTMILRSIYQGALYNFLTTQKDKEPPNSVAELIAREYKLIVNVATNDSFSDTPILRDKLIQVLIMNITDAGGFPLLEANPDKHYVTGTPKDFLTYHVSTYNKHGVFHVLKEKVFAQQLCIYFTKHSYLVESFDRLIQKLRNCGLIDYWARTLMDERYLQSGKDNSSKHASLTLAQLSGIFQMCLGLYFLAFILFLCEIILFNMKRK